MSEAQESQQAWVNPVQMAPPGQLSAAAINQWREAGFTLVDELLPQELLQQAQADALDYFPAPGSPAADDFTQFGSAQRFVFPASSAAANALTLHPLMLQAAADLLDVPMTDLRLTQSDLWPKYGPTVSAPTAAGDAAPPRNQQDNADQRIHCDYPNHTLTHPPRWDAPEAVEVIVYLSTEADCGGATAVVPRRGPDDPAYPWPITRTPGVAGFDYVNDKTSAEAYLEAQAPAVAAFRAEHLYAREVKAKYNFGSVLLYRHDTWHRGTPMKPDALRTVLNLTFKKASSDWVSVLHPGWSWAMYRRGQPMEHLIANLTVEQRAVLGFPLPGSQYWNRDTLTAVQARYAAYGMDMSPYWSALGLS